MTRPGTATVELIDGTLPTDWPDGTEPFLRQFDPRFPCSSKPTSKSADLSG